MKYIVVVFFVNIIITGCIYDKRVGLKESRFEKRGESVYDKRTRLTWESRPSASKFTWSDAKKHCKTKGSSWRLPNLYELKSLVDYGKYNPAIATDLIKVQTDDWYWSSSPYKNDASRAWVLDFGNGLDDWYGHSDYNYVLCVQ